MHAGSQRMLMSDISAMFRLINIFHSSSLQCQCVKNLRSLTGSLASDLQRQLYKCWLCDEWSCSRPWVAWLQLVHVWLCLMAGVSHQRTVVAKSIRLRAKPVKHLYSYAPLIIIQDAITSAHSVITLWSRTPVSSVHNIAVYRKEVNEVFRKRTNKQKTIHCNNPIFRQ